MDLQSIILFLFIGLAAGWLAGQIMKDKKYGLVGDLIIGVVGSFLGGWLFGILGIRAGSTFLGQLVTALVGAIVLLFVLRLFRRR